MNAKLFQNFAGVIPAGSATINGVAIATDTPFLAMGLFIAKEWTSPILLCLVQGGKMISIASDAVVIELSDEMKKALAEVVLTS